jgi:tripartite-type tricarboxylate transporter receptor subunit TctC
MLGDVGSMLTHIRSDRVRALAVTTKSPQLPAVPTLAAMGYLKSEPSVAFMVVAPAGTPSIIVERLSTEIATFMKSATAKERLDSQGYVPTFDTPNEFSANLKQERAMWSEVIRRNNVAVD